MAETLLTALFGTKSDRDLRELVPDSPAHQRTRARHARPRRRGVSPPQRRLPPAARRRGAARRHPARGLRARARGRAPSSGRAAVRRADDGRGGAAPGTDRGNEDRRRQDPRERAGSVPQRTRRAGRAHRHGQRLPRRARRRVDGTGVPAAGRLGRRHPRPDGQRPPQGVLREGHHLRHQQRVRIRLPARQHVLQPGREGPARPRLRDRRRDRQHPHRRGAHAAHHLGLGGGRHGPLLRGQPDRAGPRGVREGPRHGRVPRGARGGLQDRREGQAGHLHRPGHEPHRGAARRGPDHHGLAVHGRELRAPPLRHPEPARAQALPQGCRLRGAGRPGSDRRRVHGPDPARPALLRRAAPGHRGQGTHQDRAAKPHARDHHLPELLPHVRQARRA